MLYLIIGWVIGAIFAFLCAFMAKNRGRNPKIWGILGLVFSVFAVIALAIMGEASPPEKDSLSGDETTI